MAETSAFVTSLIFNLCIALFALLLFSIIRTSLPWLYYPRKEQQIRNTKGNRYHLPPPVLGSGCCSWLIACFSLSDDELMETSGLDAVMLVKFYRMGLIFFGIISFNGLIVLLPINATADGGKSGFDMLSMSNVPQESNRLWAHFVANIWFSFLAYYMLHHVSGEYVRLRHEWLQKNHRLGTMRTLLVHAIPKQYRKNDAAFREFWDHIYPNQVLRAVLAEDRRDLDKLVDKKQADELALEHAVAVSEQSGEPPKHRPHYWSCEKVESIPYYKNEIKETNEKIEVELKREVRMLRAGFVTFKNSYTASYAVRVEQSAKVDTWISKLAPEVRDVYWPALFHREKTKFTRTIMVNVAVFFLIFFWTIPVTFVSSIATSAALSDQLPFLSFVQDNDVARGFIEGVLPTLILYAFMALLPLMLLALAKMRCIEAFSWQGMTVANYYFLFQVFNVFLVFLISNSIFDQISGLIDHPTTIVSLLGDSLPKVANFFTNYIMLQAFAGYPLQLLQILRLLVVYPKVRWMCKTEKEVLIAQMPPAMDYSTVFPRASLVFMIAMAYATIAPIILPFAFIYFAFGYVVYYNQLMYVFIPEFESGGEFWPVVFQHCCAALVVAQLTLIGLFGVKLAPSQAALSVVMPFLTVAFYYYTVSRFWRKAETLPLELAVNVDKSDKLDARVDYERKHSEAEQIDHEAELVYTHPAITKLKQMRIGEDEIEGNKAVPRLHMGNQLKGDAGAIVQRLT